MTAAVAMIGASVAVVAPTPAAAEPGFTFEADASPVTSVGGNGGTPFTRTDCPAGSIATGIRASVAQNDALWATVFSLQCREITADGLSLSSTATFTSPARGNPLSVVPDSQAVLECPSGQVLTGVQAYATTTAPVPWFGGTTPPIITETFPRCRAFDLSALVPVISGPTTQVTTPLTPGAPPAESALSVADCPDGRFIVGFGGREGWAVDRFEPYCGTLRVSGYTATVTPSSFAMPTTGMTISSARTGGTTMTLTSGVATRVWPGTYTTTLSVPGAVRSEWFTTTRSPDCDVTLAHAATATCTITVTGRPDTAVEVTGSALTAGGTGQVTVDVSNVGPAPGTAAVTVTATGSVVFGALPAGCTGGGQSVTCTTSSLAGATATDGTGAGTASIVIPTTAPSSAGAGTSTITATAVTTGDGVTGNDTDQATIALSAAPPTTAPPTTTPPAPPTTTPPTTTPPTTTPPATTPPTTAPRTPVPAPVAARSGVVVRDGALVDVPLPPAVGGRAVASAVTGSRTGVWAVTAEGQVSTSGDARSFGSLEDVRLNEPVVGIAPTASGAGYLIAAADGGVFAFGDASFHGSAATLPLVAPAVSITQTSSGRGYYLVTADGGVFAFGDAVFHGSMAGRRLNAPMVGLVPMPGERGYWLVAADGGVFAFGDAPFHGSLGATGSASPVVGLVVGPSTTYWVVRADGTSERFGPAPN